MVIALPQAITVTEIAIDPTATCGDGGSASIGRLQRRDVTDGTTWTLVAEGRFGIDDRGRLNPVTPARQRPPGSRSCGSP